MDAALPARCGSRRPAAKRTRKSPQSHAIISLRDRRPLSCMSRARFGTTGQGCRRAVVSGTNGRRRRPSRLSSHISAARACRPTLANLVPPRIQKPARSCRSRATSATLSPAARRASAACFNAVGYFRCFISSSPRETVPYLPCLIFGVHYTSGWLFLLFLAAKYQPSVGCPPRTPWVFDRHASPKTAKNLAVPGCFRESPAGSGSHMHGGRRLPI
jgi:hypothetical protein